MRVKKEIPMNLINMDRIPLDRKTLRFTYAMQAMAEFPAIKVAKRQDGRYEIRDGRHRWVAHKLLGREKILAKFSDTPLKSPEEMTLLQLVKVLKIDEGRAYSMIKKFGLKSMQNHLSRIKIRNQRRQEKNETETA